MCSGVPILTIQKSNLGKGKGKGKEIILGLPRGGRDPVGRPPRSQWPRSHLIKAAPLGPIMGPQTSFKRKREFRFLV